MSVDTNVKGKNTAAYRKLRHERFQILITPTLIGMAEMATEQLIRRIENHQVRNRDIELENRLVIRESTEPRVRDSITQSGGV